MLVYLLALQFGSLVSSAVLQLPQTIAQIASNDSLVQWINSNISLSSTSATLLSDSEWNGTLDMSDTRMKYFCDGGRFDRDLSPQSCLSAWASIPRNVAPEVTFGWRDSDTRYDVGLPKRYLSSDGKCAIEPVLMPGRSLARARLADLALASSDVIDDCVNGKTSTGGLIWNFAACESIADGMRTSSMQTTFGLQGTDPDIVLPKRIRSKDGLCTMVISTSSSNQVDTSVWYKFWDAAVALNAMCIRQGQNGVWPDLGIKGNLQIEVFGGSFGGNLTES